MIIDEGFRALDEVNRGLLISELSRLREEVIQGGRVIVVSIRMMFEKSSPISYF
jgi:DNA repair protein SbcC/Rad50